MKKYVFVAVVITCFLASCGHPSGTSTQPGASTIIVFDNTQGLCTVAVYDSYQRREQDKIAEVPAGRLSAEIEYTPGVSVPFYFLYRVSLKGISGFTVNYVPEIGKDQTAVRIDANKTTTIPIPKLDETLSSPDTLLSTNSYLLIQNNSPYSFQLHRGSGAISPDNLPDSLVNSGERALYTINPGSASPYQLLVGADYKAFSGSIVSFEAGRVYSFVFDGNVSLITEVEIKLENVAGIPQNNSGPDAPGAPAVTASDGLLTLRWTAVQGAESYEVYVSTAQEPPAVPEKTVTGTTTVLTGLVNKTAYYIWIKAVNSSGASDYSPSGRGIPWPLNEIPAVPVRPVIIPGINQLTVNWEECGGAVSYEVYINTSPVSPSAPEITTDKTSAVINNLENNQIYYIWVRAVNSAGKSNYSPVEAGTPAIPTVVPAAPGRPVLTAGNRELTVSWQAVELTAAYEVWAGTSDDSAQAQKQGGDITGGVTETVITGLENETAYYVWIKAKNIVGTSGFSPSSSAKPSAFAVAPETPVAPTVTTGNRELGISWQSVEGALSYEVWAGVTNNTASAEKYGADVSGISVTLTGLVNGTTYYIWIKAKNNIGASEFSPRTSGTPSAFAAAPSAPQAAPTVIAGSGQLTVSWQTAEGANSYEVWAGTDTNPTIATKRGNDVTGLSSVITGLTNGTTYYVWIKAKNAVGTSNFSPMATGTPSSFTVTPQAPAAPSVSIGNGQITVTWSAVEGATAYEVWTGTGNNSSSATKNGADISASLSATIDNLTNGTTYYLWLKAKNNVGTSGFSTAASGKPIANATAPTLSASNGQLSVTWTAIAGADQYDVFCGNGINPPQSATQTVNAPATSAAISGLVNGTTYNVWIRGKNSTGTGAISGYASAKPIGNMGTVTLVSGNGQLTASWQAVAGADQYEVYYSSSNSIPASPTQTVAATTAAINGLTNGTIYYVWVKPKNANGTGNTSTVVSGAPMAAPGSLTVSAGNQQIAVSWSAVPGASSYEVYYSTTTTIPAEASFTVTELSRTITGLSNGTTYNFWVKAVNANGTSGASPMASGKPISNMGTVTLTTGGSGELVLNWSTVAGADEYEVYRNTINSIPGSPVQTVSTTTATISGLTNGTTYNFWVKAINAGGTGETSPMASGKPLGTPGAPTLSPAYKQLLVTWTAVAGADQYEVYYGTSTPTTLVTTTTGTTATIAGLTGGTTYYVRLRAKNANGVSAYGPNASGVPEDKRSPGLYRGIEKISTQNLDASLTYISSNAVSGDDFYIVLGSDESSPPKTLNYSGKTVKITLSGYGSERTITLNANGSMFTVNSGVTLTLDENITLVGRNYNNHALMYIGSNGTMIMNEGAKISNNINNDDYYSGGGVYVDTSGIFTMTGGEISGNKASIGYGGGVYVGSATFTMTGGKISSNNADSGGGVYVGNAIFIMTGGEISGNNADYGGGVDLGGSDSVTFTMEGGKISGNNANSGGGVWVGTTRKTFTMNGGEISGNTSSNTGGGVEVSGTFTMNGGEISGNTSSNFGGGVNVTGGTFRGTFTKTGGTITGYASDTVNGNVVKNSSGVVDSGHAVYYSSSKRNTTAGQTDQIDTTTGKGLSASGNPPFGQ